jgi:hypothetical protein
MGAIMPRREKSCGNRLEQRAGAKYIGEIDRRLHLPNQGMPAIRAAAEFA